MIDINHDQSSIMGVFLSNHSWSRTQTGALSSAGNMCVYIQSQLILNGQRQGLFPAQGPAPNWGAILVGTFELWAACEALLRRGTTTPPPTLLFLRTAFHTLGTGQDGHRCLHGRLTEGEYCKLNPKCQLLLIWSDSWGTILKPHVKDMVTLSHSFTLLYGNTVHLLDG